MSDTYRMILLEQANVRLEAERDRLIKELARVRADTFREFEQEARRRQAECNAERNPPYSSSAANAYEELADWCQQQRGGQ